MKKLVAALVALLATGSLISIATPSLATPTSGISYYISPPFVQGSYVTSDVTRVDFNLLSTGNDACSVTSGPVTVQGQDCNISNAGQYGGAQAGANDATPTVGGSGSKYASTANNTDPVVVNFSTPMKYLGFWWSAGSPSNQVTFYSGPDAILTLTTADLMTIFGTAPTAGTYGSTGTVEAVDGSVHTKHHYFGNPRGYSSTSPSSPSTLTPTEPFTFIHVMVSGSTTFDRVELKGSGFEFDNFVVSSSDQVPQDNLVFIGEVLPKVTFNANGGTGSMTAQSSGTAANLSANTFQRTGFAFAGWNTEALGGGVTYADLESYPFVVSTTLYAQWTAMPGVTFNPNGGTGSMATQYSLTAANLTANSFNRSNHVFVGWNTEQNGSGDSYADGGSFPFTASDVLYAQWAEQFTVTFDANGGTGTMSNQTSHIPADLTLNSFENEGYTFGGWNTEADGSGTSYADEDPFPFTADTTLYAVWLSPGVKPFDGAVLSGISSRTVNPCSPAPLTITGIRLLGAEVTIQGKAVRVLENTDRKLVLELPNGLAPGKGQDLLVKTGFGTLTFQNALDILDSNCSQSLSKGRWTQIQPDGKTVKVYAKDPIGDGKIQFFKDGKELAWINAVDQSDPKLRFANDFGYLVRSVELNEGKNRFEIKLNGVRVWRATYVPKGQS